MQLSNLASPSSTGETFNYLEITRSTTRFLDKLKANNLTILIDEWAQIPENAQPYFAEFIKRAFFSNKRISFKIGVVDFAYKLSVRSDEHTIGLEKSADIFADIKMDRFFVWDKHSDFVEKFFAEVLYNHLAIELNYNLDATRDEKVSCISEDLFTQKHALSELCRSSEGNARDYLAIFGRAFHYCPVIS